MKNETKLPFKVGELAEAKSFEKDYRGAWFRCRIKKINDKAAKYLLEYFDYSDEKLTWEEVYQKPPHLGKKARTKNRELIVRPCFPRICNQNEMPCDSEISQVAVVIKNDWQVGDLVDWWSRDCWWSGRIIELLGDGKAKLEFPAPPLGEGGVDEGLLKDIRPSLNWSPEHGWTVPTQDGNGGRACARLIGPMYPVPVEDDTQTCVIKTERPSISSPPSSSPEQKTVVTEIQEQTLENTVPKKKEKLIRTDTNASSPVKQRIVALNATQSDSTVAAVWDLEECLSKVKWLKAILKDISSSDDVPRPEWEFELR